MMEHKFLYTRNEAAQSLGVSTRTVDYAIARGELHTKRIGTRILVTAASLRKYAASDHPEQVRRKRAPATAKPPDPPASDAPKTGVV